MSLAIEARAYGPDCTPEERDALRNRVTLIESDVVLFFEVPVPSPYQLDIAWGRIGELTNHLPRFFLVVDLSVASRPKPEVRTHLKNLILTRRQPAYTAIATEANFVLNVAARFVFASTGLRNFSIHRHRADAIAAIARARLATPKASDGG